jgi:hypothetical protein
MNGQVYKNTTVTRVWSSSGELISWALKDRGQMGGGHGCWQQAHAAEQRQRTAVSGLDSIDRRWAVRGRRLAGNEATRGWNSYGGMRWLASTFCTWGRRTREVSGSTTRRTWQAGGDSLTREKEEAAPDSAVSTATASLSLMAHGDDLRGGENEGGELRQRPVQRDDGGAVSSYWWGWRWGEGERRSTTTGHFIACAEDDAATGGGQVGDVAWQAGPVSASAPLTGGPRCNCFPTWK